MFQQFSTFLHQSLCWSERGLVGHGDERSKNEARRKVSVIVHIRTVITICCEPFQAPTHLRLIVRVHMSRPKGKY